MRESQMKKIIATAVATAFVAPAFAADVTLSGYSEWSHVEKSTTATVTTNAQMDTSFTIGFSTETAAGLGVKGDINMDADGTHDGGNSLTITGEFGSVTLGDDSGAMDSIDGATDPFLVVDHDATTGSTQNFSDADVTWTLPALAEGLTVKLAYSPKDTESGAHATDEGTVSDQFGVMVGFSVAGLGVKVASQEVGTDKDQGVTLTYAIDGLGLAYESHQNEVSNGTKVNYRAYGATYSMGDITLAYSQTAEKTSGGADIADTTAFGIHYDLGGGVKAFAESASEDIISTKPDTTAVGIAVTF
jgi:outer membrane protein OmpU